MNTRTIYYIDENEDYLDAEVALALSSTFDQNLDTFCEAVIANYAMMNIDVSNYPVTREIYYIEDDKGRNTSRDSEDLSFLEKLKNKNESRKN